MPTRIIAPPRPSPVLRRVQTTLTAVRARTTARAAPAAQAGPRRIVRINRQGQLGNRMIQHLAALTTAEGLPDCVIEGEGLPEWGVRHSVPSARAPDLVFHDHDFDLALARRRLRRPQGACVQILGYAQDCALFGPVERARRVFQPPAAYDHVQGFGDDTLVINTRAGEIESAIHPDYVLLPAEYYRHLVQSTGLKPVVFGQISDTPYFRRLRELFPEAPFIQGQGAMADFVTLMRSRHIVCAVSTFSYMAAWLSEARTIHLPAVGLFNPRQASGQVLIPRNDRRYRLWWFPITRAVPPEAVLDAHARLRGLWRETTAQSLLAAHAAELARSRPPWRRSDALAALREAEYLHMHPDVAQAVGARPSASARRHFRLCGLREGRRPLWLDPLAYFAAHPEAADAVARGDYADALHHYIAVGRRRGLSPGPRPAWAEDAGEGEPPA